MISQKSDEDDCLDMNIEEEHTQTNAVVNFDYSFRKQEVFNFN